LGYNRAALFAQCGKRQIWAPLSVQGDTKKVFTSKALREYLQSLVVAPRRFAAWRTGALIHRSIPSH
jgi:hypothetical protein